MEKVKSWGQVITEELSQLIGHRIEKIEPWCANVFFVKTDKAAFKLSLGDARAWVSPAFYCGHCHKFTEVKDHAS